MYMRSRQDGGEVVNHEGPTVVLVKTADLSSSAPRASFTGKAPSGGGSNDDDDDVDALSGLTSGGMAGVIIGILVGVIALITVCCCYGCCACCGVKPRAARKKMDREEQVRIVAQGTELMEQRGVKTGEEMRAGTLDPGRTAVQEGTGGDGARASVEIRRVEEDTVRDYVDPPPKYAP